MRQAIQSVIDSEITAALDRAKVTDREAAFILSATAKSFGQDPADLTLSRESIRKKRMLHRETTACNIKAAFRTDEPLTVHWDGKIMADVNGDNVDRLAVLVSGEETAKLLAVPKLLNGSGSAAATAVVDALNDWELADCVAALSFDTTASNTGLSNGACTILEQKLERDLLHLACRHHMFELVAAKAFEICMGPSSGPDIALFKRFASHWSSVDQAKPKTFDSEDAESEHLTGLRDDIIAQCNTLLEKQHPRDDYRELLELTVIVLGGVPKGGIRFRRPGAFHRARWMAKLIYALKIFLFRCQFHLTRS